MPELHGVKVNELLIGTRPINPISTAITDRYYASFADLQTA